MSPEVRLASAVAREAHGGQLDKAHAPYLWHIARVAQAVREARHADEVEAVAWLHDVVEDTGWTFDALRVHGFSEAVVRAVDAITHRANEPRLDYYERVRANAIALVVKRFDVIDNHGRLDGISDPVLRERLDAKYAAARRALGMDAAPPQVFKEVEL